VADESRLALLHEGRQAFLRIRAGEQLTERLHLRAEVGGVIAAERPRTPPRTRR
jgi:hypothetical protein